MSDLTAVTEQNSVAEDAAVLSLPSNKPVSLESAQVIPIGFLYPNPHQLRTGLEDAGLGDLAASIKDVGVLEPLLVTRKGRKRYILIAGHRRLEAAKQAELSHVPCIVLDLSDDEFLHYSLIENLQRSDLTPLEEATAIRKLIDLTGLTYREIASKLGKSATFVSDRVSLLEMPKDVKEAVIGGRLSLKKALELSKVPIERFRTKLLERGAEGDLEQFKQMIQDEYARRQRTRKPYEKMDLLPELRQFAKTNDAVRIFKNRISLRYDSQEKLHQLLSELVALLQAYESEE